MNLSERSHVDKELFSEEQSSYENFINLWILYLNKN